jgi:hypothetical protein
MPAHLSRAGNRRIMLSWKCECFHVHISWVGRMRQLKWYGAELRVTSKTRALGLLTRPYPSRQVCLGWTGPRRANPSRLGLPKDPIFFDSRDDQVRLRSTLVDQMISLPHALSRENAAAESKPDWSSEYCIRLVLTSVPQSSIQPAQQTREKHPNPAAMNQHRQWICATSFPPWTTTHLRSQATSYYLILLRLLLVWSKCPSQGDGH